MKVPLDKQTLSRAIELLRQCEGVKFGFTRKWLYVKLIVITLL